MTEAELCGKRTRKVMRRRGKGVLSWARARDRKAAELRERIGHRMAEAKRHVPARQPSRRPSFWGRLFGNIGRKSAGR